MLLLCPDSASLTESLDLEEIGPLDMRRQCRARGVPLSPSWPSVPTSRCLVPARNDIYHVLPHRSLPLSDTKVSSTWRTARPSELPHLVRATSHPCATPIEHASSHFNNTMLLCTHLCASADIPVQLSNSAAAPSDFLRPSTGVVLARTAVSQQSTAALELSLHPTSTVLRQ